MEYLYDIGIDGGGTKTEAVLMTSEGEVLSRATASATNPNDVGVDVSVARMKNLIDALLSKTGISPMNVHLFAGISGALNHRDALIDTMQEQLPTMKGMEVGSDMVNLMYAELPMGDGACVICGTGSVCFLRSEDTLYRIGGWGYLLDSAGSGYDIGRMALEYALKAHDGRGNSTILTDLLTTHLGQPVQDALTDIYAKGKAYIASCAPVVFKAARMGDSVAEDILNQNAKALAEMIDTACQKRDMLGRPTDTPLPVALGGGINQKEAPTWTERVQRFLKDPQRVSLMVANTPMVVGAVMKAYTNHHPHLTSDDYMAHTAKVKQGYHAYMQSTSP